MKIRLTGLVVMALAFVGTAQASSVFEGRAANGSVDLTCTASGSTKCAMFYYRSLDITILNNWNTGTGIWGFPEVPGSAQYLVNRVASELTGLDGWYLPTGDGSQAGGSGNQFLSIWDAAGGTFSGLQANFDGVQSGAYWSSSILGLGDYSAWIFGTDGGGQAAIGFFNYFSTLAVRPGDVAPAAIPEPEVYVLMLAGLGLLAGVARRRNKQQ